MNWTRVLPKAAAVAVVGLLAALSAGSAQAAQIVLTGSAVIGDTGGFNFPGTAHPGAFPAGRIFDQQTGIIASEVFGGAYWLNGDNGPAAAFITFDLGAAYELSAFELFNTSNGNVGDRGTGNFSIVASNSLVADGANGFTLGGAPVTLASGALAAQATNTARVAQSFSASDGGAYRYLQFRPTSVASPTAICCGIQNNYGLNELRVFGDLPDPGGSVVPEPSAWALMILGFGGAGAALRGQRRRTATAA